MPFPFLPFGALFACLVLLALLTAFWLAGRALDRTFTAVGTSILPGLVAGMEAWGSSREPARMAPLSSGHDAAQNAVPQGLPGPFEELPAAPEVEVQRVRR